MRQDDLHNELSLDVRRARVVDEPHAERIARVTGGRIQARAHPFARPLRWPRCPCRQRRRRCGS
jgi:hypothetical protein